MNTLTGNRRSFSARRVLLVMVALSITSLLALTVSAGAVATSGGRIPLSSTAIEVDSIPGSPASEIGSSLEGPLMATDPTFVVTDPLKGPLALDGPSSSTGLKNPLT